MTTLNSFQFDLARRIVLYARQQHLTPGARLTEAGLGAVLGVSRSPIRVALRYLATAGFLEIKPNLGYFLVDDPGHFDSEVLGADHEPSATLYRAIALDRFRRDLPTVVSESALMRRYRVTRSVLRKTLTMIAEEGWIERRRGKGWGFLPGLDSKKAYADSFAFRRVVEPAGILAENFAIDREEWELLCAQQRDICRDGYCAMEEVELVYLNAHFHETIAAWSNNEFIYRSVRRQNRLRRPVEMFQSVDRERIRKKAGEHLEILELLGRGELAAASAALAAHLSDPPLIKLRPGRLDRLLADGVENGVLAKRREPLPEERAADSVARAEAPPRLKPYSPAE